MTLGCWRMVLFPPEGLLDKSRVSHLESMLFCLSILRQWALRGKNRPLLIGFWCRKSKFADSGSSQDDQQVYLSTIFLDRSHSTGTGSKCPGRLW